jgi:hypothetical protein
MQNRTARDAFFLKGVSTSKRDYTAGVRDGGQARRFHAEVVNR